MNLRSLTAPFVAGLCLTVLPAQPAQASPNPVEPTDFVTVWAITEKYKELNLPVLEGGKYAFDVFWGDGSQSHVTDTSQAGHRYDSAGNYQVVIRGTFEGWGFPKRAKPAIDRRRLAHHLREVRQWGSMRLGNAGWYFARTRNLAFTATDAPDLRGVTNMRNAFAEAVGFNSSLGDWDLSGVEHADGMFRGAHAFNQSLDHWDARNLRTADRMFAAASAFNQPLDHWDTSGLRSGDMMFAYAGAFNQPLDQWDTSNFRSARDMFNGALAFDQPIGTWDTSRLRYAQRMFRGTARFNQPLDGWDTRSLVSARGMFAGTKAFNQPLAGWDTRKFRVASGMFAGARKFNQPLNAWDTSGLQLARKMFSRTRKFDQPLNSWDTSSLVNAGYMFYEAFAFDQPLDRWNVSRVRVANAMFVRSPLSTPNYDALLRGWSRQDVRTGVYFDAGNVKYGTSAADARRRLAKFWQMADGGPVASATS